MISDQMEFGLSARGNRRRAQRGQERRQRAQWWFNRMRQVVDTTLEWAPTPPARHEQVYMALGRPAR